MNGCGVCEVNEAKYKCPKCKIPYCCLNCFKMHRPECPGVQGVPDSSPCAPVSPFESFRSHPKIVEALSDHRLQKVIRRIDSAQDREAELIREMATNFYFKQFVSQLLVAAPKSIEP